MMMQGHEQVQRGEWLSYLLSSYMFYFLLSQGILSIVKCDSFNIGMESKYVGISNVKKMRMG